MRSKKEISLVLIVLFSLFSCDDEVKNKEITKSREYAIEINTWGIPGSTRFKVILDNVSYKSNLSLQPSTLYVIKQEDSAYIKRSDTINVKLTLEQSDSIFIYTNSFLSDFTISNLKVLDNSAHLEKRIEDGANLSISLYSNGKKLEASHYHLKGISHASPAIRSLVNLINTLVPKDFAIY